MRASVIFAPHFVHGASIRRSRNKVGTGGEAGMNALQNRRAHLRRQDGGFGPVTILAATRPRRALCVRTVTTCVYRKLKLGRSDGEVRQGWRVIWLQIRQNVRQLARYRACIGSSCYIYVGILLIAERPEDVRRSRIDR